MRFVVCCQGKKLDHDTQFACVFSNLRLVKFGGDSLYLQNFL